MRIDQLQPRPTAAEPLEIPAKLLDSVARHHAHVIALVASLRAAGVEEDLVDVSVRTLVDSYADELTIVVKAILKAPQHV